MPVALLTASWPSVDGVASILPQRGMMGAVGLTWEGGGRKGLSSFRMGPTYLALLISVEQNIGSAAA